jgi:hypothetical protein
MFSTFGYSFLEVKVKRKENKKTLNHTYSYLTANRDRMNNASCMLLILKSRCITHRHLFNFIILWNSVANFIEYFMFLLFLYWEWYLMHLTRLIAKGRPLLGQNFLACTFILNLMMVERTTEICRRKKIIKGLIVSGCCFCVDWIAID